MAKQNKMWRTKHFESTGINIVITKNLCKAGLQYRNQQTLWIMEQTNVKDSTQTISLKLQHREWSACKRGDSGDPRLNPTAS